MHYEYVYDAPENLKRTTKGIGGVGFDKLSEVLGYRKHGATRPLQEQRPLYLIAHYADSQTATTESLKELVADGWGLQPDEAELITSIALGDLDDQIANQIIENKSRPIILPLVIGSGEQPEWWVGPLWLFYTPGNVVAFKDQLYDRIRTIRARETVTD